MTKKILKGFLAVDCLFFAFHFGGIAGVIALMFGIVIALDAVK